MKTMTTGTYASVLLLITFWGALLDEVMGWGTIGHEMVANLAYNRLTNETRNAVLRILGPTNGTDEAGSPMAAVADWADQVRFHYHWSSPLHYIDIRDDTVDGGCPCVIPPPPNHGINNLQHETSTSSPLTEQQKVSNETMCHFLYERDCPNDICVAGAIQNYTAQLESWRYRRTKRSLRRRSKSAKEDVIVRQALMFLIHFVGDIHQPLHSARTSDKGGNDLHVHFNVQKMKRPHKSRDGSHHHSWNLHSVWDTAILERAIDVEYSGSRESFEQDLAEVSRRANFTHKIAHWLNCSDGRKKDCTIIWAEESFEAALEWAYRNVDNTDVATGSVLDELYYETRLPVVKERILAAGVRLAATLERLFYVSTSIPFWIGQIA